MFGEVLVEVAQLNARLNGDGQISMRIVDHAIQLPGVDGDNCVARFGRVARCFPDPVARCGVLVSAKVASNWASAGRSAGRSMAQICELLIVVGIGLFDLVLITTVVP